MFLIAFGVSLDEFICKLWRNRTADEDESEKKVLSSLKTYAKISIAVPAYLQYCTGAGVSFRSTHENIIANTLRIRKEGSAS